MRMRVAGMRGSSWTIERSRPSGSLATQGPENIYEVFEFRWKKAAFGIDVYRER